MHVAHQRGLGDFQFQELGGQPAVLQRFDHRVDQVVGVEVGGGDVDRHPDRRQSRLLPDAVLPARCADGPLVDVDDQARFFGDGQEFARQYQPVATLPAGQALYADDPPAQTVDLRLVVQDEVAVA